MRIIENEYSNIVECYNELTKAWEEVNALAKFLNELKNQTLKSIERTDEEKVN